MPDFANPRSTTELSDAELAARLRMAIARLARRLRRETEGPISPSQLSALSTVGRLGPLTLGALSSAEGVRPPTMTRVVACLEDQGFVARTVDADDRRVSRVSATAAGQQFLDRTRHRRDAFLAARLRALDTDDRAALARAAVLLEGLLEGE